MEILFLLVLIGVFILFYNKNKSDELKKKTYAPKYQVTELNRKNDELLSENKVLKNKIDRLKKEIDDFKSERNKISLKDSEIKELTAKLKRQEKKLPSEIGNAWFEGMLESIDVHRSARDELFDFLKNNPQKRKTVKRELRNICSKEFGNSYESMNVGKKIMHNAERENPKFYFDLFFSDRPLLLSVLSISEHPKGKNEDKRIADRQAEFRGWTD